MGAPSEPEGPVGVGELAELLRETAHRHHAAYSASDGVDPEWAMWYARYLQARLGSRLGEIPTRADLVYLLVGADRAFQERATNGADWPEAYAAAILKSHLATEAG